MTARDVVASFTLLLVLSACGGGSGTTTPTDLPGAAASDVHVLTPTVTPDGTTAADVELALHNAGSTRDRLVAVSCTCATAAEIHGGSAAGDEGPVEGIPLPPDKVVLFGPLGPHIVLLNLLAPLAVGDTVTLSFAFETAAPTTAVASVMAAKAPSPAA